jgi:hypothetical protein
MALRLMQRESTRWQHYSVQMLFITRVIDSCLLEYKLPTLNLHLPSQASLPLRSLSTAAHCNEVHCLISLCVTQVFVPVILNLHLRATNIHTPVPRNVHRRAPYISTLDSYRETSLPNPSLPFELEFSSFTAYLIFNRCVGGAVR